jgi:hypothetical protein
LFTSYSYFFLDVQISETHDMQNINIESQERKNHDLHRDMKNLESKEYRETLLESIKLAGTTFGEGRYIHMHIHLTYL